MPGEGAGRALRHRPRRWPTTCGRFLAGEPIAGAAGHAAGAGGEVGAAEADPGRRVHARAAGGAARRAGGYGRVAVAGRGRARDAAKSAQAEPNTSGTPQMSPEGRPRRPASGEEGPGRGRTGSGRSSSGSSTGGPSQVAHQEWRENNVAATVALLDSTRADLRGWEWRYVHRLCHSDLLTLKGHTDAVTSASFSPDGSRIVTASEDGTAKVWDAQQRCRDPHAQGAHPDSARSVLRRAFSPGRRRGVVSRGSCSDETRRRSGTPGAVPRSSRSRGTPVASVRRRSARTGRGS